MTQANGTSERNAAFEMIGTIKTDGPITLGADNGDDAAEFVQRLGTARVIPHIAQNTQGRRPAVADRIARTPACALSQLARNRIEEIPDWAKEIVGMAQTKFRGRARIDWRFTMTLAAGNKVKVVAACRRRGVSIASVALAHGLNANLLRRWIHEREGDCVIRARPVHDSAACRSSIPRDVGPRFRGKPVQRVRRDNPATLDPFSLWEGGRGGAAEVIRAQDSRGASSPV